MDEQNPAEMDQETALLSRLAANHLHLAQFEPLRAVLLTLRRKTPGLALTILQTIVANAGRFEKIVWSSSCQSSSLLTYLSTLELLQYTDSTSRAWSFDPGTLQLRVEFLLLVQQLRDRVVDNKGSDGGVEQDNLDGTARPGESLDKIESSKDSSSDLEDCVGVLDKVLELGVERLKPDIEAGEDVEGWQRRVASIGILIDETELMCLRGTIIENSDVFDALCFNIQQQLKILEVDNPGLAVTVRRDDKAGLDMMEKAEDEDRNVLGLIQKVVQLVHLDAVKNWIKENNEELAASHIRYLHLEYGVEEAEYRLVLQDLLFRIWDRRESYGEPWNLMQKNLLRIYNEALSSNTIHLTEIIQVIQDDLLSKEIERFQSQDSNQIPPPLERFRRFLLQIRADADVTELDSSLNATTSLCMRDMFHYARVSGLHVLELIMNASLSTIKKDELQEANDILILFPRLRPLVAVMGWDLLSGKTASRKKLMQLLWTSSESQVSRLEESSLYGDKVDEVSCVDHLCNLLCYHIDLASFVACVNSGQSWNSKTSLLFSGTQPSMAGAEDSQEAFVENFVLERLSVQSPLRVLFDVVPVIKFQDAIELISMQPMASTVESWRRMQDIELMHMRYALESIVLALTVIGKSTTDDKDTNHRAAVYYLKSLRNHLESVTNIPRKILMVNVIISLLHMDDTSLNLTHRASPGSMPESPSTSAWEHSDVATIEGGNELVISFTELLLDILNRSLPLGAIEEIAVDDELSIGGRQALDWRVSLARSFIDDWKWRLTILQSLLPLSDHHWGWKEALSVLRAAPSKLLNLCMQKAKYDIGEEAVHRFSLSAEDRATLELAEWVDGAFRRASESRLVEDAVSRAADGASTVHDIDLTSLRSQIGPLAATLLCIDVAATSARSTRTSQRLLHQAQIMLSEIYPGGSPKMGSTYWDQMLEVGVISVSRRVLKRLNELLEHDDSPGLQPILTGESAIISSKELLRPGQRERALAMLHQMIEDAHQGKRQFLSGKLHNLARAIADEETEISPRKGDDQETEQRVLFDFDKDGVLGLGLKVVKQIPRTGASVEPTVQPLGYDAKDDGKKLFSPLSAKPTTYLSQFILYIAAIGDIVDGTDTTHDFNFFSLVYEWPKDLLTRLVFDRGSTDAAAKVADIMSADFVHEVISACVPPVYPPRSGHGWARIPVSTGYSKSYSESKVLSPSSKEIKPDCNGHFSGIPGFPLYPLQLDIVKHLVKLSPVRAVLACVFGSGILYRSNESYMSNSFYEGLLPPPDTDRVFYEFALDQSERFPTLNRWIQMQTNLHRVLEFAGTSKQKDDGIEAKGDLRTARKRIREHDGDAETEVDELSNRTMSSSFHDIDSRDGETSEMQDTLKFNDAKPDNTVYLSLDWENEELYDKAVERLIGEGKLMEALALSDRFLHGGASDQLLQLLVERNEENHSNFGRPQIYGGQGIWSNSWQYCLRLKNKQLAAELALKYMNRWELDAALDVLTMCSCHLTDHDSVRNEVLQRKQALQRYSHILGADDRYSDWQEVEAECKEDPEGLALRLAERGAVSAALEVAESAGLSIELRRELQGRQLVKLLTADPLNGGGPAEASRFLSSLSDSDDALPVAMGAMQLLPNLRSKQLLVHFFLKRRDGNLADVEVARLSSWALGLRVLAALPLPWQQRCSALHEHPHLILEVLLMRKQLESAALILKEFPSIRDDNVIISYAAKAIAVSTSSPTREPRVSVSGTRQKAKPKTGAPTKSSFSSSLSNLQKEARRAFSWAPKNTGDKNPPKDAYRKRKSSGLPQSERVAWEAMAGIGEERDPSFSGDGQERLASISIAEEWMLTGDPNKDVAVRASHRYESAPDVILLKALLSLCPDESVSAKSAVDLCIQQMKNVLSSQQVPENASMEAIGRAHHATKAFVQGLLFAKSLLKKPASGTESSRDVDDEFSDAGSSSAGSQPTDEISQILAQADVWLGRAELLQSLLGLGIAVSLDDIADQESSAHLRDRLIADERYSMAVYTCRKCKIDVVPVWNAWGHALIRIERYEQARVKFKQALQSYKGDPAPFVLEIINTIEGGPPADVSAVRSLYEHLAKSAPMILDDSLSADSYLNVLYIPTTFPRSERSRLQEHLGNDSTTNPEIQEGPRSNLDSIRYAECVNYLQEFSRQHLLGFMFRHGRYTDACMLFFPQNSVPQSPLPSAAIAGTSSSPQRLDPLATDYGTLEDICDLCIGYGAMSILEEVLVERMTSAQQDEIVHQHTAAAIARICTYCETHRHFNYLCRFQVIKKDHVAAGLCCIQLFMNSSSQEEAVKHLENAKIHFDEGLSARYKGGESTKHVSKGVRGKSAYEKLTEEGLVKLAARVSIQVEVVKSSNDSDGPQWRRSLFGNPNDPETFRRRCEIAETLVERNFDLAFQVIYEFNLPAVDIYAGVASSLAERKKGGQLTEFFRNIKGTIDDDDWDQVLGAAINVYANKHKERPDRLIDMLTSSHRKVLACVVCGRLKSAFQIASRSGSVADVQYVAHQALHANALPVLDMCKQWLAQYM